MKNNNHTYLIGEIGQNHNGSVDLAKLIVDYISKPVREDLFGLELERMDAVKLTKRDLSEELSKSQMDKPYINENSFGKTYGEHRAFLELNDEEHFDIYKHAKSKGLDFVETLCAIGAMSLLKLFTPDYLKVASRDLTNLPLLEALAETKIPMIVSTGMAGKSEIDEAINVITKHQNNLTILHCVSQYPTHPSNVNLNTLPFLMETYPDFKIGYSDHTIGISTPIAAVAMGAKVIEKHVTLDRRMKGTDQKSSLGVDGIYRMVRDIRLLEKSFGTKAIFVADGVDGARIKLERSIASKRALKKGEKITIDDIHMLSPGDGIKWINKELIIGKSVKKDIPKDEIIYPNLIV